MKLRNGQTMIELMIAIAVIAVGLFSAMNMVYSNLALVNRDSDEVVAINLSREGIELAKQARDSDWLAGNAFDQGLFKTSDPTDYTGTVVWSGAAGAFPSFNFTANAITDANAKIVLANGLYQQTGASGSSTAFARLVTFHPICDNGAGTGYIVKNPTDSPNNCEALGFPKVGIRIESAIRWTRANITKNTVIYSDIYDWR